MTVSNTIEIPETGSGEVPEWVVIARTGRWMGHAQGPEIVTPAHLASALDSFNRNYRANNADLVIDYHHASAVVPTGAEKAPAAGWIREMELRPSQTGMSGPPDQLWGRVMWTAEAARAIAAREFRYLSPVFRFGAPDRVSAQLVLMSIPSVALTNTPFFTELQALNSRTGILACSGAGIPACSCQTGMSDPPIPPKEGGEKMGILNSIATAVGKKLEEVASMLGLPASADGAAGAEDKQVAEAIMCLAARAGTLEGEIREIATIANVSTVAFDPAAVKTNVLSLQGSRERILGVLRVTLGLGQDADETAVLNSVQTLQAESRNRHAVALIDEAVASGRLPPALREFFINSACADLDATRQCLNALPPLIPGRSAGSHRSLADQQRELSEGEQHVCRLLGLSAGAFLYAESMTRQ